MGSNSHETEEPLANRHLWQFAAVRDLAMILGVVLVLAALYGLRFILAPIALAFALAYVVDPAVLFVHRRTGASRVGVSLILLLIFFGLVTAFAIWLVPELIAQLDALVRRLPDYGQMILARQNDLLDWASTQPTSRATTQNAADPTTAAEMFNRTNPQQVIEALVTGTGRAFGFVGTVVSTATYLTVAAILILVFFVFFVARFDRLDDIKKFFPASRRERIWELLGHVNKAFSAYVRGQFVVAIFTTTGFCVGFWLVGVPYWFVVSLVGGALSLIPYGQMSGWLLAILFKYVESQTGDATFSWVGVLLAPSVVYAITQSMETWVITPWVQGEAANLHPIIVIIVLIVGGSVAGILGLILAIPLTASARMLYHEVVQPRLRPWLEAH